MKRRTLRSKAPVQVVLELRWSVVGMTLLRLLGVRAIAECGGVPKSLSIAEALKAVGAVMRQPHRRTRRADSLMRHLSRALKDTYRRRGSKAARHWPHKKTDHPPGHPNIRDANELQVLAAQQLQAKNQAA